jgi:hypothetical protein
MSSSSISGSSSSLGGGGGGGGGGLFFGSVLGRQLSKATHAQYLSTLSEWSRFRAAKKFDPPSGPGGGGGGAAGRGGGGSSSAGGSSSSFRVQVPKRLVVAVASVFLFLPLSLFGWKEVHDATTNDQARNKRKKLLRGSGSSSTRRDPLGYVEDPHQWMESHLFKKEEDIPVAAAVRDAPPTLPPSPTDAGSGGSSSDALSATAVEAEGKGDSTPEEEVTDAKAPADALLGTEQSGAAAAEPLEDVIPEGEKINEEEEEGGSDEDDSTGEGDDKGEEEPAEDAGAGGAGGGD